MNQTAQRHDDTFEKLAMAALFVFIGLLTVVWAGAQLAALLAHGHPLHTTFEEAGKAMLAMKDHIGDPRAAWLPEQREQLPGPVLYLGGDGGGGARRHRRRLRRLEGVP